MAAEQSWQFCFMIYFLCMGAAFVFSVIISVIIPLSCRQGVTFGFSLITFEALYFHNIQSEFKHIS